MPWRLLSVDGVCLGDDRCRVDSTVYFNGIDVKIRADSNVLFLGGSTGAVVQDAGETLGRVNADFHFHDLMFGWLFALYFLPPASGFSTPLLLHPLLKPMAAPHPHQTRPTGRSCIPSDQAHSQHGTSTCTFLSTLSSSSRTSALWVHHTNTLAYTWGASFPCRIDK